MSIPRLTTRPSGAGGGRRQRHHHAGQRHRNRLQPAPPCQAEDQGDGGKAAGKGYALAAMLYEQRRMDGGGGHGKLRTGRNSERRWLGQRIAQHPLEKQASEAQRRARDDRDRDARQEAVEKDDAVELGHLRELESDGIIDRKIFDKVPPHVEYSLSEKGRTLIPILLAMADWGSEGDS